MKNTSTINIKTRRFGSAALLCALALTVSLILCGCNDIFAPGYGPSIGGGGNERPSGSGDISDPGQGYFVGTETAPDAVSGSLETVPDPSAGSGTIVSDFVIETSDGSYSREGGTYILTAAGTYTVSGRLEEGQIRIAAPESA
ncbi:MAG: hypothetical protein J6V01_06930 [Clostridia bacterium]|nr:hypothetical protein [Clostridia bacterium]